MAWAITYLSAAALATCCVKLISRLDSGKR